MWLLLIYLCLLFFFQIVESDPTTVKNFAVWIRYDSSTGTHNMMKEYRDTTVCGAVDQMYEELSGRHRVRPRSIQIMRTAIIADGDIKRTSLLQFQGDTKFPLVNRKRRTPTKNLRATFRASRLSTFCQ